MQFKDWTYLGNYEFFNNKLKVLTTNELPPEKWSYAGKSDFGILRSYLRFTFEKLWQERESAEEPEKQQYIYMDDNISCFNTGLYDKTWQPIYFYCEKNPIEGFQPWRFKAFYNSYTIKFSKKPLIKSALPYRFWIWYNSPNKVMVVHGNEARNIYRYGIQLPQEEN